MNKYEVFSDSACDLPTDFIKSFGVTIIPFKISFDKKTKLTDGVDISADEFYPKLEASGGMPKTYFPTVRNYVDAFKPCLEAGRDILCICLSSKLSKSYDSALNAKKILSHIYKENKIMVIDSMLASGGQGLLVKDAVELREDNEVETACRKLEEVKKGSLTVVTISSLEQLSKGGRLSTSAAALGKILKINPIIYLEKGVLVTKGKELGRQNALNELKSRILKEMNGEPAKYDACMLHSRRPAEAALIEKQLISEHGLSFALKPIEIGMTIGMHTGASMIAVAFVKKIT